MWKKPWKELKSDEKHSRRNYKWIYERKGEKMLGGGSFLAQDKVLPGTYINFVNAGVASPVIGIRGTAAVPMILNWGPENKVFEVTAEEFQKNSRALFGYSYGDPVMMPVRELFRNMTKGIFCRINGGEKASNSFSTAKYSGILGNSLMTVISKHVDNENKYDVKTLLFGKEMDKQTVISAADLKDNEYVTFKADAELSETAGTSLTGGTNGADVTEQDYTGFLEKMESRSFQILCCPASEEPVKALFAAFTKRMREENGIKFQTVMHQYSQADYEGVISVENQTEEEPVGLIYWTAGAEAACAVNETIENKVYNGEYTVKTGYTQEQLSEGITAGKLLFHKVGDEVRVLRDINTLTSYTAEKGNDFSSNQTIRVLDQIGNDIAAIFNNRYLGKIPNDEAGRVSLWNDIVSYVKQMAGRRAIEAVKSDDIQVEKGQTKRSVVVNFPVEPINSMSQLYMTVVVQ